MTSSYYDDLISAADVIKDRLGHADLAIVLGSGLSGFIEHIENRKEISFSNVPGLPSPSVKGHSGTIVHGKLANEFSETGDITVLCFAGRVHGYEGWKSSSISFYARTAILVGCKILLATNSSGGCLPGMKPGSVIILEDHLRLTNICPLEEYCDDPRLGPRHFSPNSSYNPDLIEIAYRKANSIRIDAHKGTYCWVPGPSYETPAEIQAGIRLGGAAFGMSTVPEILAFSAMGGHVLALSLATNLASGISQTELSHVEVTQVAREAGPKFQELVLAIVKEINIANFEVVDLSKEKFVEPKHLKGKEQWADVNVIEGAQAFFGGCNWSSMTAVFTAEIDVSRYTNISSEWKLCDIPGFDSVASSPSAASGKLYIARYFQNSCILVIEGKIEGFTAYESWFLALLLYSMSVTTVVQFLPAFSEGDDLSGLCSIQSCVDRSSNRYPAACLRPPVDASVYSLAELSPVHYFYLPGPSLPSRHDINSALIAQCKVFGITNIAPLEMSRLLGLRVYGIVSVITDVSHEILGLERVLQMMATMEQVPIVRKYFPFRGTNSLSTRQEDIVDVKSIANDLRLFLPEGLNSAVIVSSDAAPALDAFLEYSSTAIFLDWKKYQNLDVSEWSMNVAEINSVPVLLIHEIDSNENPPFYGLCFLIRCLKFASINRLVFVFPVTYIDPILKSNQVVCISDHINMTGRNPLSGPNEEEFGTRFPDMSYVYDKSTNDLLKKKQIIPVVTALVSNPLMDSTSQKVFFRNLGAHCLCTGSVYEVSVAKHMRMTVNSLAFEKGSAPIEKLTECIKICLE